MERTPRRSTRPSPGASWQVHASCSTVSDLDSVLHARVGFARIRLREASENCHRELSLPAARVQLSAPPLGLRGLAFEEDPAQAAEQGEDGPETQPREIRAGLSVRLHAAPQHACLNAPASRLSSVPRFAQRRRLRVAHRRSTIAAPPLTSRGSGWCAERFLSGLRGALGRVRADRRVPDQAAAHHAHLGGHGR